MCVCVPVCVYVKFLRFGPERGSISELLNLSCGGHCVWGLTAALSFSAAVAQRHEAKPHNVN